MVPRQDCSGLTVRHAPSCSMSRHLPAGWHAAAPFTRPTEHAASTRFAARVLMAFFTRSTRRVADIVGRVFNRFAAVTVGLLLIVVGVGMMVTIVMLPVGVILDLLGVLILVGGLFAPDQRTERNTEQ